MTGNDDATAAPALVGRAIEVARRPGFSLTRQQASGNGPSASLPGVGRFLAVSPVREHDPKRELWSGEDRLIWTEVVLPDLANSLLVGTRI